MSLHKFIVPSKYKGRPFVIWTGEKGAEAFEAAFDKAIREEFHKYLKTKQDVSKMSTMQGKRRL